MNLFVGAGLKVSHRDRDPYYWLTFRLATTQALSLLLTSRGAAIKGSE